MGIAVLASSLVVLLALGSASAESASPAPRGRIVFVSSRAIPGQNRLNTGKSDVFSLDLASGRTRDLSPTASDDTDPVSSPGGKLIAFVRRSLSGESSLWLMNGDGRAQRRLVDFAAGNIAWSPNGRMLAFTTAAPVALWVVDVGGGGGLRRLADFEVHGLSWSPDGSEIAFAGRERQVSSVLDHIGVVRLDGGPVLWLTGPGNEDFSPVWSPDGTQLVFVRSEGPCVCAPENLELIRADGTGERQLTPYDGRTPGQFAPIGSPSWSPSGDWIVFTRDASGGGAGLGQQLDAIRSDGSNPRTLARDAFAPAWAPSGTRLAFVQLVRRARRPVGFGIDVEQLGGRARRVHLEPWPSYLAGGPSWSRDGKSLVYASNFGGRNDFELFSITPRRTGLRQLTRDTLDEFDPAWSSDGRRIAFARGKLTGDFGIERSSLFVIDGDGRHARQLTRGRRDHAPSWAPDGKRIAFSRGSDLAILDLGSRRVRLLRSCAGCSGPAWSPDGGLVAFANGTRLEAIRPDGHGERTLFDGGTKLDGQVPAQISDPSWSPDGRSIAFHLLYDYGQPTAQPPQEESELRVSRTGKTLGTLPCRLPATLPPFPVDVRGGTSAYFDTERVTWSPDSRWLAASGGEPRVWICENGGSGAFWLTRGLEPAWQPVGRR